VYGLPNLRNTRYQSIPNIYKYKDVSPIESKKSFTREKRTASQGFDSRVKVFPFLSTT
tara:strand:+ start:239 stop:412 length:174 start_codon:yes stop_codon:yes gene_type:complete